MKRIIFLSLTVLLVVLCWSAGWYYIADQIRQNIVALAQNTDDQSPTLVCGTLDISGYPFHFNADCTQAELRQGDLSARLAGLRASAQFYQPNHIIASALGPIDLSNSFTGSKSQVSWDGLQASIRLEGWRIARVSVIGDNLAWTETLFGKTPIANSPHVEFHLLDIPEQYDAQTHHAALALYTQAQNVGVPGLAIADGGLSIQAELSGLPDDIRAFSDPYFLQAIAAADGSLKIIDISASDGPTSTLTASGELGLDAQGLLNGKMDLTSTGMVERVGPLIAEPFRTLVLGNPSADGSYTQKLSARGGTIFSGLVPVTSLPPLF